MEFLHKKCRFAPRYTGVQFGNIAVEVASTRWVPPRWPISTMSFLITSHNAMISAEPRRTHNNSVQKSETRQPKLEPIIYDAFAMARKYAKLRAQTQIIARKIQREKLDAVKKRQANNFGAMDLDESRRHRKSQEAKLKNSENSVVVKPKTLNGDVGDKFLKGRYK